MNTIVKLYSKKESEIFRFLKSFYSISSNLEMKDFNVKSSTLEWEHNYQNPIEIANIIGDFIDNNDKFQIHMWISLDPHMLIHVTDSNVNEIIKYLYERFPY